MREIVFIHTVPMIIETLNRDILSKSKDISLENIMDDRILKLVSADEDMALARLNKLISMAEGEGPNTREIVITCSSLSDISKRVGREVTMIDTFLHREASKYKKILLAATADTAIAPTRNGILRYADENIHIDELFIEGAIARFKSGDKETHDVMVMEKVKEALGKEDYEAVVFCQASMAHLKDPMETNGDTKVLTNIHYFVESYI